MQESKTRKRREERIRKPIAPDDDDEDWETVTRPGKQMTIQVCVCVCGTLLQWKNKKVAFVEGTLVLYVSCS